MNKKYLYLGQTTIILYCKDVNVDTRRYWDNFSVMVFFLLLNIMLREGVKRKPIESLIMIIPCRTPPSFLRSVMALSSYFCDIF